MVWRVAVLSARRCSGARPSAAVCRFVSSQVWQIVHPLLSCDLSLPPFAVQIFLFLFFPLSTVITGSALLAIFIFFFFLLGPV